MHIVRSRRKELTLVGLTVVGALVLGIATASLTGGNAPGADVQITTFNSNTVSPATTETSTEIGEVATEPAVSAMETPTPSVTATPVPVAAETTATAPREELFVQETFDAPAPAFPSRETTRWSVGYVDQRYQFKLNGQTLIGASLALPAENYRLGVDVAVSQGGAGLAFLISQPATRYHIIVSPDGAYAIERLDNNVATKIVDWTPSPALQKKPGATNRLQLERHGDTIRFFANDQLLTDFTVPAGQFEPQFGLVLTSRTGQGEASFDNLLGERLP